jgi:hypothetical protein
VSAPRVLVVLLLAGACAAEDELPPPGSAFACQLQPPTGCPGDLPYCCTMEDALETYCVAEPLLGDEWICAADPP